MKKITMMLLAVCLAFGLTACGNKDQETKGNQTAGSDAQTTAAESGSGEKGTFTVGFDADFPPFGYMDENGDYVGFDLDLAAECASRMGKELVLKPINWDAKDMELSSGSIDCIWNGFTMNGREADYAFTKSYMDNSQVVVIKKDSGITSLADLAGKTVLVQTDSSAQAALLDEENEEMKTLVASFKGLETIADYNTAMMELESGAVDAVGMDIFVAKYQIEGKEDIYEILDDHISTEQYGVGFYKANTALKDEVEGILMEMADDGTFAEISDKWFGLDVCTLK
ncbi:MAG: amino acid ABC transporter substrate-binding protein [Lachnospiraceae bacterium]|nr:amino acid ABC transporter substrate-binding protein [Lachnospiraceae bacterium]